MLTESSSPSPRRAVTRRSGSSQCWGSRTTIVGLGDCWSTLSTSLGWWSRGSPKQPVVSSMVSSFRLPRRS